MIEWFYMLKLRWRLWRARKSLQKLVNKMDQELAKPVVPKPKL